MYFKYLNMFYYRFTVFIIKGGGIGVMHGKVLCVYLASPIPIENKLESLEKISIIILNEIRKIEEYITAHKVRLDTSKEISDSIFEKGKIKVILTF